MGNLTSHIITEEAESSYEQIMDSLKNLGNPRDVSGADLRDNLEKYCQLLLDIEEDLATQSKLGGDHEIAKQTAEEKEKKARRTYKVDDPSNVLVKRTLVTAVASAVLTGINITQWSKGKDEDYVQGSAASLGLASTIASTMWLYDSYTALQNDKEKAENDRADKLIDLKKDITKLIKEKTREELDRLKDNSASRHREQNDIRAYYWQKQYPELSHRVEEGPYTEIDQEEITSLFYVGVALVAYYSSKYAENPKNQSYYTLAAIMSEDLTKMVQKVARHSGDIEIPIQSLAEFNENLPTIYAQILYQRGRLVNTKGFQGEKEVFRGYLQHAKTLRSHIDALNSGYVDNYNGKNSPKKEKLGDTVLFERSGILEYDLREAMGEKEPNRKKELLKALSGKYEKIADSSSDKLHSFRCKESEIRIDNMIAGISEDRDEVNDRANQAKIKLFGRDKAANIDNLKAMWKDEHVTDNVDYKNSLFRRAANFLGILLKNDALGGNPVASDANGNPLNFEHLQKMHSFIKQHAPEGGAKFACEENQEAISSKIASENLALLEELPAFDIAPRGTVEQLDQSTQGRERQS